MTKIYFFSDFSAEFLPCLAIFDNILISFGGDSPP